MIRVNVILLFINLLIVEVNLYSQSLATNILFEQAKFVFKGEVKKISSISFEEDSHNYMLVVEIEKIYKNTPLSVGDEYNIIIEKIFMIDTITHTYIVDTSSQIKRHGKYVFFINNDHHLTEYWIEGIPFSNELESDIEYFDNQSFTSTHNYGSLPMKLLCQGSPSFANGEIVLIEQVNTANFNYELTVKTINNDFIKIHVKSLHCISQDGVIKVGRKYVFFLTPIKSNEFLLTDIWLGIIESSPNIDRLVEIYQNRRGK